MAGNRFHLSDEQWNLVKVRLNANERVPKLVSDRVAADGILNVLLTGLSWRDCPAEFGPHLTLLNRFSHWIECGIWPRMMIDLAKYPCSRPLALPVYTTDATGRITFCNDAAKVVWGRTPELNKERWIGAWRLYSMDGRPLPHDQCALALSLKCNRPLKGVRLEIQRPDGTRITVAAFPAPLQSADDGVTGAVDVSVPIVRREYGASIS